MCERVRQRLTYHEKSTNLQSKRKEAPAKVSMKNFRERKKKRKEKKKKVGILCQ